MKTILITGINGYLGSHLAKTFQPDHTIIGLEYSLENLFRIESCGFPVYESSIDNLNLIFNKYAIDTIIHTATFYGRNNEDLEQIFSSNLHFPFVLLNKAIANKCSLFVNTDTVLDRFVSPYSLTKKQFDDWLRLRCNEILIANMQLEHFFGPDGSSTNFVTAMVNRMKNNEKSIDLTMGEQLRHFVYIDDVVSAFELVYNNKSRLEKNYNCFQVATDELIQLKEMLLLIKDYTKSTSNLNFGAIPYRENELMKSESDNSSLKAIGWIPKTNIQKGIELVCSNV